MNRPFFAALVVLCSCGPSDALVSNVDDDVLTATDEAELRANTDPDRLVVYSNNLENMIFDWKDLVHEMGRRPVRPDIFLVQQISGREGLDRMTSFMNTRLGGNYEGKVAQDHPTDTRFSGEVIPRPKVSTGIIWRAGRFDLVASDRWFTFGKGFKNQAQSCDVRNEHSGYETLRVRLFDRLARKHVVVVSLRHWTWEPCSSKNVRELINGLDSGPLSHGGIGAGADLAIVGGDFNDRPFDADGTYACWYRQMNRDLGEAQCAGAADFGFTDTLFASCDGDRACVRDRAGVDSLFVRRGDGKPVRTNAFDIITWDDGHRASVESTGGDGPSNSQGRDGYVDQAERYSGHEARRANVFYK